MTSIDQPAQCSRGWGERCANARGPKCRCRCGGRNHNHGKLWTAKMEQETLKLTPPRTFEPTFDDDYKVQWAAGLFPDAPREGAFRFHRLEPRPGAVRIELPNGNPLIQRYVSHSPTGFEWGYGGSGPSDLALNLCGLYVPAPEAWAMHHDFKWRFVAPMPEEGGYLAVAPVVEWIEDKLKEMRKAETTR